MHSCNLSTAMIESDHVKTANCSLVDFVEIYKISLIKSVRKIGI